MNYINLILIIQCNSYEIQYFVKIEYLLMYSVKSVKVGRSAGSG